MKDKVAREDIEVLRERLDSLEKKEPDFVIRQCPKCKHDTVQVKKWDYDCSLSAATFYAMANPNYSYTICTNCGIKVECVTETVCKEYKD